MATAQLIQYIRQQVVLGEDPKDIVRDLQARNWSISDINDGFRSAGSWVRFILASRPIAANADSIPEVNIEDVVVSDADQKSKSFIKRYWGTIGAFLILSLGGAWTYITGTPQYSLYQMYEAIEDGSMSGFSRYAAIDGMAQNSPAASVAGGSMTVTEINSRVQAGDFMMEYRPNNIIGYITMPVEKGQQYARATLTTSDGVKIHVTMQRSGNHWKVISTPYQL